MIAIVASSSRERTAFTAVCEGRGWTVLECETVRAFAALVRRSPPAVVLCRHRLSDGYSDDVLHTLGHAGLLPTTKVVVMVGAGTTSSVEARQIALGADAVQRDPVRTDVLLEYIAKFLRASRPGGAPADDNVASLPFGGGILNVAQRTLRHGEGVIALTPREVQLAELLVQSTGRVVSYDILYSDILRRRFRGETSNMRVLLGKLIASARKAGIELRRCVEVIPKSGYRYTDAVGTSRASKTRGTMLSAA